MGIIQVNGPSFKLSKKLVEFYHGFTEIALARLKLPPDRLEELYRQQRQKDQQLEELHRIILVWVQAELNMTPSIEVFKETRQIAQAIYPYVYQQLEFLTF